MTTENTGQNGQAEQWAAMSCCSPKKCAAMMAKCGQDMKGECGAMMQKMLKGGCCQPEEK